MDEFNVRWTSASAVHITVERTWDGEPLGSAHKAAELALEVADEAGLLKIAVQAPLLDPVDSGRPTGPAGHLDGLWEYEVVELFLANSESERYLELEFGPYGHYLAYRFDGVRRMESKGFAIGYTAAVDDGCWRALADVPVHIMPAHLDVINAFAVHGCHTAAGTTCGRAAPRPWLDGRYYEALFPADPLVVRQPDFHLLQYFRSNASIDPLLHQINALNAAS